MGCRAKLRNVFSSVSEHERSENGFDPCQRDAYTTGRMIVIEIPKYPQPNKETVPVTVMPAKSKKQQQFMAICAHHPDKAKGKCPSHKVAQEFSHKPEGGYKPRIKKRDPRNVKFY